MGASLMVGLAFARANRPRGIAAARWIAWRMRRYVAQRQMLPFIAASMSASVGFGVLREQRRGRHQLAGLTVAALRHVELLPRALQRMRAVGRQPFDRRDLGAGDRRHAALCTSASRVPLMCTVHAPHCAMPQPNFVPLRSSTSRSTQSSGMSAGTSTVWDLPLTLNVIAM